MQTFKKLERLCSKKVIEELISKGSSFNEFPFKVIYHQTKLDSSSPAQVVISVSKRNFKKAVSRNKLKRRTREAYRKNKDLLYEALQKKEQQLAIMLIYIAKEEIEYKEIESKIIVTLRKLAEKLKS